MQFFKTSRGFCSLGFGSLGFSALGFSSLPLPLACTFLAVIHPAVAEESELPIVTINAPAYVEALSGATAINTELLKQQSPATGDSAGLISKVPGVTLNATGGVSSLLSIRGLADDRVRIKLDGMDLIASCPNHMNPPLSYVAPSNIGEVQVYAGISPVSVSGDSIAGSIIVETIEPEFASPAQQSVSKGELGAYYRSNNNAFGVNAMASYATEDFSLKYSGSSSRANNYSAAEAFKTDTATGRTGHTLGLDEVGSTAFKTQNHSLDMAVKLGGDLLKLGIGYQDMPSQLYPNQRMDLLENEQSRVNFLYLMEFDWGSLETRAYHETVDHYMNFGDDKQFVYGTAVDGMPMYSQSTNTGISLEGVVDIGEQDLLRVGADLQHYQLDDWWPPSGTGGMAPDTFKNINNGKRDRYAIFTEWEHNPTEQWQALIGIRYERVQTDADDVHGYDATNGMGMMTSNQLLDSTNFNDQNHSVKDDNVDATLLARYNYDENLDIEFGLARKVRSPNLYERYTWSTWAMAAIMNNTVGDGNGYVGDIDLAPEKAYTASATFDWHASDRNWELQATPYYTWVDDYIDAEKRAGWVDDQFNVLQYSNQSARLYGIDIVGKMPLGENEMGAFGFEALLNYTHGENAKTGDNLYNIKPLNTTLMLTHQTNGWNNAVEWELVSAKDEVNAVRNESEKAGYGLVNLRMSKSVDNLRVNFGVENLFDKFYYLSTGGAYTGQGSTMGINSVPWGVGVPGPGRSFYLDLNISF